MRPVRRRAAAQGNAFRRLTFVILSSANNAGHPMARHGRLRRLAVETAAPTRSEEEESQFSRISVNTRPAPVATEGRRGTSSRSGRVTS